MRQFRMYVSAREVPGDRRPYRNQTFSLMRQKKPRGIRQYNMQAKPVKWKYFDPTRRITTDLIDTAH